MEPDIWMPLVRPDDLVTTPSGDELLVYDQRRHHIHQLNPFAAAVWRACDGQRPVAAIATSVSAALGVAVDPGAVRLALTQLAEVDLLAAAPPDAERGSRQSRRRLLRKAAAAGLALPAIASVTAPDAAATASCVGEWFDCTGRTCCVGSCIHGQCCSDEICGNTCCTYGSCVGDICCPSGLKCGDGCCFDVCLAGVCCPSERECNGTCCAAGSTCVQGLCCANDNLCGGGCCVVGDCVGDVCMSTVPPV